jgi:hypothetical protein
MRESIIEIIEKTTAEFLRGQLQGQSMTSVNINRHAYALGIQ